MKKKILFMIPSLGGGGAERVFVNLVNNIDKSIYDVTLVYLSDERNVYEVSSSIRVINLKVNRVRRAPLKIIKLIWSEKPDLIVSTLGHLNIMLLMLKTFFPKKVKLIIRQTLIASLNKSNNKIMKRIQGWQSRLYRKADKIICQSEYMRDDFIYVTGIEEKRVVKIHNPVDVDSVLIKSNEKLGYKLNDDQINIFFAGRLDKVKRIPLIIDAFKRFHKNTSNSKLYILGEGPQKKELKDYVEKNKLSNAVEFLGFQTNPYKWLNHADLFIMASSHEGMPNVLIEVLALEKPVLILKHPGGTKDILCSLDIENRFVNKLVINQDSFKQYSREILPKLKLHFGVENVTKQYELLFMSVIKEEN